MTAAISNVLETMFFLPVQFAEGPNSPREWFSDKQSLLAAKVGFDGPSSGELWFLAPVSVMNEITASFLGLGKDEINEEQLRDTIEEALNMIAGQGLSLVDGKDSFALGIPRLTDAVEILESTQKNSAEHIIFIETGHNRLAAGVEFD
ncbi:MAG: chemotaxis protein CheX [Thermodesulfobacteriota bacterium]